MMILESRSMFAVCTVALLCLMSQSLSAPLACENLVQPLDPLDISHFLGKWVVVAASLKDTKAMDALKKTNSITVDISSSSFTQSTHFCDRSTKESLDFSVEGPTVTITGKSFNYTGTFYSTTCSHCAVWKLDVTSEQDSSVDMYLLSRNNEVGQTEMEEFKAQLECLNMPSPFKINQMSQTLFQPLDPLDISHFLGKWVFVAGSLKDAKDMEAFKKADSMAVEMSSSSFTQFIRLGDGCKTETLDFSVAGPTITFTGKSFNYTGTFYNTTCSHCAVWKLEVTSAQGSSVDMYLLSRNKEVEQAEIEEFKAQLECLNMPSPFQTDPTKELCPEEPSTGSGPGDSEQ